jgi:hypothetical protein
MNTESPAQPQQELVALETVYKTIIHWEECGGKRSRRELARRIVDLYTSLLARKPLTDEEIDAINVRLAGSRDLSHLFARSIEAAHGIKNTP